MEQDELDLLEREERIFTCFQAAIELMNLSKEEFDPEKTKELLDFLVEEYIQAREALMEMVRDKLGDKLLEQQREQQCECVTR